MLGCFNLCLEMKCLWTTLPCLIVAVHLKEEALTLLIPKTTASPPEIARHFKSMEMDQLEMLLYSKILPEAYVDVSALTSASC